MVNMFSAGNLDIEEIYAHYVDIIKSLDVYFSEDQREYEVRFFGYARKEVAQELAERKNEASLVYSLSILAALEAAFRIDFQKRCKRRGRDTISRKFREINKINKNHISLDEDILEAWRSGNSIQRKIVGDIRAVLKLRHWLAHGRYWVPKLGANFSIIEVFILSQTVMKSFPFER